MKYLRTLFLSALAVGFFANAQDTPRSILENIATSENNQEISVQHKDINPLSTSCGTLVYKDIKISHDDITGNDYYPPLQNYLIHGHGIKYDVKTQDKNTEFRIFYLIDNQSAPQFATYTDTYGKKNLIFQEIYINSTGTFSFFSPRFDNLYISNKSINKNSTLKNLLFENAVDDEIFNGYGSSLEERTAVLEKSKRYCLTKEQNPSLNIEENRKLLKTEFDFRVPKRTGGTNYTIDINDLLEFKPELSLYNSIDGFYSHYRDNVTIKLVQ